MKIIYKEKAMNIMTYLILYRCEECQSAFGLFEENEKDYPYCPVCSSDDTMATAELLKGEITPDSRDW